MSAAAEGNALARPTPADPATTLQADATQHAVDRALESAQALLRELRAARFAALARHARNTGE